MKENYEPLKFIKPKWVEDDEKDFLRARQEAEMQLEKCRVKYKEMRKLELDDMKDLRQEHFQFK